MYDRPTGNFNIGMPQKYRIHSANEICKCWSISPSILGISFETHLDLIQKIMHQEKRVHWTIYDVYGNYIYIYHSESRWLATRISLGLSWLQKLKQSTFPEWRVPSTSTAVYWVTYLNNNHNKRIAEQLAFLHQHFKEITEITWQSQEMGNK